MPGLGRRLIEGFRHAFDLGPQGPVVPTSDEQETLDRILREIVRRGMVGPAILFLDSAHPLNGISAAAIHFFSPFAGAIVDEAALRRIAGFLERRGSIEWLCRRLEELETESSRAHSREQPPEQADDDTSPSTREPND